MLREFHLRSTSAEIPATAFKEFIKLKATPVVLHAFSFSSLIPKEYRFAIFDGWCIHQTHKSQNIMILPPSFLISVN
jgi:hypothetical protein